MILLDWLKQLQLYRCSVKLLHLRYLELLDFLELLAASSISGCMRHQTPGRSASLLGLPKGATSSSAKVSQKHMSHLIMSHLFMDRTYGETFPSLIAVRFLGQKLKGIQSWLWLSCVA